MHEVNPDEPSKEIVRLDPSDPDYYAPDRDYRLYEQYREHCIAGYFEKDGHFTVQTGYEEFVRDYDDDREHDAKKHGKDCPFDADYLKGLQDTTNAVFAYAKFHAGGRNIFSIPSSLADKFDRTDASQVCMDELHLPYRSMFIAFGIRENLQHTDGSYVDGAYICKAFYRDEPVITIRLSLYNPKINYGGPLDNVREKADDLSFILPSGPGVSVGSGLDKVKPLELLPIRARWDEPDPIVRSAALSFVALRENEVEYGKAALAAAIDLTVNSLCHISTSRAHLTELAPRPDFALFDQEPQNRKERRRREHELRKMAEGGYSRIRLCVDDEPAQSGPSRGMGSEKCSHKRKAHERIFRGPDGKIRKIVKIQEMAIRPDKGPPKRGHNYVVVASDKTPDRTEERSAQEEKLPVVPSLTNLPHVPDTVPASQSVTK